MLRRANRVAHDQHAFDRAVEQLIFLRCAQAGGTRQLGIAAEQTRLPFRARAPESIAERPIQPRIGGKPGVDWAKGSIFFDQQWEYLDLPRFWQILLVVGLFLWMAIIFRAIRARPLLLTTFWRP